MAGKKSARKGTKSANRATENAGTSGGLTAEERDAMREHIKELKAASRRGANADLEGEVLAKIATMPASDRAMAERLHAIIKASAPELSPKLWYGMPAYARDGNVVCFFQGAHKFKARYGTFGFSDKATLDDGEMWPTSFALRHLTPADEARISALVRKAVG